MIEMTAEERLEMVEKELARVKRNNHYLMAFSGLVVLTLVLARVLAEGGTTAQAQGKPIDRRVVRANEFILEDEKGEERAKLVIAKDGPQLALFDERGKLRAGMRVGKDMPQLALFDVNGKLRAMLAVGDEGRPQLVMSDEKGRLRTGIGETANGPMLFMADENGRTRADMSVFKDGPGLALSDEKGRTLWSAL